MTETDLAEGSKWIRPPRVFTLHAKERKQIEALDSIPFLPVTFRPVLSDAFYLETEGAHGQSVSQWQTSAPYGFVSTPKLALDKITIRFVSHGSIVRRNYQSDYLGTSGMGMFVDFEEMVTEEASPGFRAFAGTVDRSALLASHQALEGDDEHPLPQFEPVVDINTASLRAFRHNFQLVYQRLHEGVDYGDLIFALLEELVIYQFLTAWPKVVAQKQVPALQPSWQVRRAMEYIDANLKQKITLAEIAAIAQTGVRSLQLSFRKELGKTPVQWILERRLKNVHRELKCDAFEFTSISATARKWGFVHMADFARRYRKLFGESPLQTRRRRH
ncbi:MULTISPECIES: helix-turn-helix transcriptional regulator [Rhizobium/Agrobacterium group]|uniref:helix-turn-helix transcriptional regulator n=1 Tax=Rhizobium/Agrobacterium group TaxID=227290 RepID=UPI001AD9BB84|nr:MULTISPECIES: helix-turn-helix transcriptional regulator [Rhizobium/Agrobacterium group]MBO9112450.1 helix-turn-helix transcriptional regulator [Agrobacterium sp. S2/73]QXZ75958.1 helix-turn-helix transcriptional regulator [Agrobacterium sp. S7/73]QYA17031.1 helix-turn-helix transcriptional regulator [Rhizobium sp. AB2/73]UEQ85396.1 helix-turn-helix transcriptional regulator [Rhizobium sp. AB2/73]